MTSTESLLVNGSTISRDRLAALGERDGDEQAAKWLAAQPEQWETGEPSEG